MALSGNKLLGMLESSGYKVPKVTTNSSTSTKPPASSNSNESNAAVKHFVSQIENSPVRNVKNKDEEDKWFQKGAFDDGYQFGDVFKTILGTAGDVGVGAVKGASKLLGGVADAIGYGIAEVAEAAGNDNLAYRYRNSKSGAELVDDAFAPIDEFFNRSSVLGKKSDSIAEGLGQVGAVILTGGLGAAAGLGAVGTTALTTGLMGVSSFGSGMSEAFASGATEEEAATYGLIKGVVDAGSEMIFGGLGKTVKALGISRGLSSLDDMFAKSLSSKITNQVAKNFVQFGVKASAEGVEEVLAGFGSAVGKKLTYMSDEDLKTLVKDENLLEQFVAGAVTSGFAQSGLVPGMRRGSLAEANKTGRDFVSGLSGVEQTVIDKVYKDRVAEAEKSGKQSASQKNKIYDKVVSDMEKGRISTDTIEELLDEEGYSAYKKEADAFFTSDTYKSWKDTVSSEESQIKQLEDELEKLNDAPNTVGNSKKYDAIQQQIEQLKSNPKSAELKAILDQEAKRIGGLHNELRTKVSNSLKDSKLYESYRELARSNEKFTADLSQYKNENARKTIENIMNSGVASNTNEFHEVADFLAKISADKGITFSTTDTERLKGTRYEVKGKIVNGFVDENGNVTLNLDSKNGTQFTVGHEITHVLERTEFYKEMQSAIKNYAISKMGQEAYNAKLKELEERYKGIGDANKEMTADLVGEYIFSDADFVRNLSVNHRNVFQKIFDEIKYLCKIATAGSKEARELERVKKLFEDAYRATKNTATQSSVNKTDVINADVSATFAPAEPLTNESSDAIAPLNEPETNETQAPIEVSLSDSDGTQLTEGQQEFFKRSQNRDDYGNLLVMYHGTRKSGFHVFDPQFSDDGISLFFTDSNDVASSYSESFDTYAAQTPDSSDDINGFDTGLDNQEVNYKVYLNLVNPLVVDAKGRQWNDISDSNSFSQKVYNSYEQLTGAEKSALHSLAASCSSVSDFSNDFFNACCSEDEAPFGFYYDFDEYSDVSEESSTPFSSAADKLDIDPLTFRFENLFEIAKANFSEDALRKFCVEPLTTREYAQLAKEQGYDGVIFKNLVDIGGHAANEFGASTVAIAFDSNQIKSVANTKPTSGPDIRYSLSDSDGRELSTAVQKRFGNSKVVDENGSLKVVYHGTASGEFSIFDKSKGSVEGDFGSGFYFTDNQSDVSEHYEGGGPDFEIKVARLAEQIEAEEDIDYDEAEEKAREQLYKGSHLFEVYLNIENPAIVGETMLLNGESYMEQYNEEDFEDYDEYLEEVEQLVSDDIEKIVWEVERNVDLYSTDGIAEILWEAYSEGGMDIEDLKKRLNDLYLEDNNGNLVANEVARQIIESLGYDGIIDPTVSGKWNMDIEEGTKHYIVFKPNQIKAVSNQNPTDNPDIHRSLSGLYEDIAPIGNYNVYGNDVAYDPSLAPVDEDTQGTTRQQPRNPILDKKGSKVWNAFKDNVIDRGTVFETMSIKSGNRELDAKFRAINRAATSAQYFMKKGNTNAESLDSIRSAVEKSGKTKRFEKYLYHLHNVDRMNVNKPVFGSHVTAEQSAAEAARLEKANPEFKQWADDVYSYMGELREMMVENGMITPETRDLWNEMYPHYVPIRRNGEDMPGFVPTDDQNIAVNAPVKRATGGSSEILPLFDTMAIRTEQTFKAVAKNKFGVELMHVLGGSPVGVRDVGIDESIDSVSFEQLQRGMPGRNPTMTVYENGKQVTFEITEEMYKTMQPKSDFMASEIKPLSKASDLKRKLITEYNPSFALRNPIKDAQDVLFNSQHAAKTYANFPKAAFELLNKKGQYYQEYMENGGESVTYFNEDTQTFAKEKSGISKVIGFPLDAISKVNNFIERVPRMAEYIASRESGRSIDVSMLDAARVTTDFSAGGDLTKFLNRNGFTFLNSSVQGAVQNVRNIREAKAEGLKGWAKLAAKVVVAGLPELILNNLLWEDDEEYDDLADYIKRDYYVVAKYGDGQFVRIPKGRVAAVISNAFTQMQDKITGDDEFDFDTFGYLVAKNLLPNEPLDNNIFAPFVQAYREKAWHGGEFFRNGIEELPALEQYDEKTDSLSRWLSEKANDLLDVEISPYKINYVLENTTGILGDYFLPMMTPAAEQGDDSLMGKLLAPIRDDFTADSVLSNQKVTDFFGLEEELAATAAAIGSTPEDLMSSVYANSVGYEMSVLYGKKREIQNSNLPDSEKYRQVREIQKQINALAKKGLSSYDDDVYVNGKYGEVADKRFNFDTEDDLWYEIKPKKADGDDNYYYQQEQKVTKNLGISFDEYWNNRELYDDAAYYFGYKPEMLGVAKTVFGDDFAKYAAEISQISGVDLDGDGKSDKNTKKPKVLAYIDGLDISDVEKDILKKMNYQYEKTDNRAIAEYLNSREDLSYDDRVNVLSNLGFKVADDGRITNFGPGSSYGGGGGGTSYKSGRQQKAIERYGITAAEYQANPDLYKNADYYFDNKYLDDDLDLEFVAKTVFGLDEFVQYAAELSQIKGDDLDGDGKSDSGTKKKKIFAYIDSLDIPDIEKEILRKMSYRYEKRSNTRIINYLKNREDISDDDRLRVLRGLGFKVFDDGRISW